VHFLSLRVLIHVLVLRPIVKLLFGVSTEGRDNVEGLAQFILVANHNSHLDILLLFHILPAREIERTHPVAAYDYFSRSRIVLGVVSFLFQPVWITRGDTRSDPLEGMRERLRQGRNIVVFPEGTRGAPGELAPFQRGVGQLATEFRDVPIVPVFLAGSEKALPRMASIPVPIWARVIVGPPQISSGSRRDIAAALEAMVRELAESEMGQRHQRSPRSREVPIIAALGIDGSGKSTLSRNLAQRLSANARVCLVSDDVVFYEGGDAQEVRPLLTEKLRGAISRRAKSAGSLKSYKVPKLAELLLRDHVAGEIRRWYAPDAIVMDGCPLLNMTAWAKLYKEEEFDAPICASALAILSGDDDDIPASDPIYSAFPELVALKRLHLAGLKRPDAVLFLDVDPAVSMGRIESRGEAQQVHETEEKLTKLRDGYRTVCEVVAEEWQIPARTLAGGGGIEEVTDAAMRELEAVDAPALQRLQGTRATSGGTADE